MKLPEEMKLLCKAGEKIEVEFLQSQDSEGKVIPDKYYVKIDKEIN